MRQGIDADAGAMVARWETLRRDGEVHLAAGVDCDGIIQVIRVDTHGRVVWSPEVDRLCAVLADIADLPDVQSDEAAGMARRALEAFAAAESGVAPAPVDCR